MKFVVIVCGNAHFFSQRSSGVHSSRTCKYSRIKCNWTGVPLKMRLLRLACQGCSFNVVWIYGTLIRKYFRIDFHLNG